MVCKDYQVGIGATYHKAIACIFNCQQPLLSLKKGFGQK